ncbi:fructosamine kinase family protein [Halobacillus litoralis]|uniref:fructosamine kinase family protein n=1 Tax=Halobacillus litoralis TaxID=45668 RepID=UPI001CFD7526|nr:fructosamine kinase family protein [Halobacillus litoralis]WLR48862.1 fructosamine kinase family protein [Halobacillus litoralis]
MELFIRETLEKVNDTSTVRSIKPISGGDINQSFYVETDRRPYFIKFNENVASHFFQAEAEGLRLIKETGAIRVPDVYHYDCPDGDEKASLVMEWIEKGSLNASHSLGKSLAHMHHHTSEKYGYGKPTFVGELDQTNEWCTAWTEYYRRYRLGGQLEIGMAEGTISGLREERLKRLMDRIEEFIPRKPKASLLHGDLWGGNWMSTRDGEPVLIDPSVLYGDHAFELALTELFGGFPSNFFDQYNTYFQLPDDYQDTKPIYQLFYLLAHLNMFGEMYGSQVDRILKNYVG